MDLRIRLGRPIRVLIESYCARHILIFEHNFMNLEVLDFVLQNPIFVKNLLSDSDDALHFEKVKELNLYIEIIRTGGYLEEGSENGRVAKSSDAGR